MSIPMVRMALLTLVVITLQPRKSSASDFTRSCFTKHCRGLSGLQSPDRQRRTENFPDKLTSKSRMDPSQMIRSDSTDGAASEFACKQVFEQSFVSRVIHVDPLRDDDIEAEYVAPPFLSKEYTSRQDFTSEVTEYIQTKGTNISHLRFYKPGVMKRLMVKEIMDQRCTLGESQIDVAFLYVDPSTNRTHIVGIIKLQRKIGNFQTETIIGDIYQTLDYGATCFAYSAWGCRKKSRSEPVVLLLIYPQRLYRISIWKPENSVEFPFGLMHKIEMTTDLRMIGWVLDKYVARCNHDLAALHKTRRVTWVNPLDWSPVNFPFDEGLRSLHSKFSPNFGFLFQTSWHKIQDLVSSNALIYETCRSEVDPEAKIIVKYLSTLMHLSPQHQWYHIQRIVLWERQQCLDRAISDARSNVSREENSSKGFNSEEPALRTGQKCIKHPYIAVALFYPSHYIIAMEDVGDALSDVADDPQFQNNWKCNKQLREAFFADVGLSALSLVDLLGMFHGDIRPQNVAFRNRAFCLIDFDMSSRQVSMEMEMSRLLHRRALQCKAHMKLVTVAQIALVVFYLETRHSTHQLFTYWFAKQDLQCTPNFLSEFMSWMCGKSGLVREIFGINEPNAGVIDPTSRFFTDALKSVLDLD